MRRLLFLLLTLACAANAFAWGPDGHIIVCRIALLELQSTPATLQRVNELTALYRDPEGNPVAGFADGCNFPDVARGRVEDAERPIKWVQEFRQFNNWHFLNVPRETFAISPTDCAEDCILKGIAYHTKGLTLPGVSENQHAQALLFLGHWLGDIHQPLHISYRDDRGGNDVLVTQDSFFERSKAREGQPQRPVNLHSVWDSRILSNLRGTTTVDQLAQDLQGAITDAQRAQWVLATPLDWAQESYDISTLPAVEYCEWKPGANGEACAAKSGERLLTAEYQDKFDDVVKRRLQQAGVRLAAWIRKGITAPAQ